MDFTNINDPSGVKALLDQLRSSQAWQDTVNPPNTASSPTPGPFVGSSVSFSGSPPVASTQENGYVPQASREVSLTPSSSRSFDANAPPGPSASSSSVASLLSQLQASPSIGAIIASAPAPTLHTPPLAASAVSTISSSYHPPPAEALRANSATSLAAPAARRQDLRSCTFQQSLPHLARLSEDPDFVESIQRMKKEQVVLERQLWEERRAIHRRHEEKVKMARTKAQIIGAGLTAYEADTLSESFRRELRQFDRDRVLPAWDGLVAKQQTTLESLGVPTMFPTTDTADRERQQRIMSVISGILGGEGP